MVNSGVMVSYPAFHNSGKDIVKTAFLAFGLVALSYLLQGNIGLNLADEGYLWYGTIQTAAGQVPMRDFQSYDPGRYYWGALWSYVFGDGIMALRASTAVFQALGLFLGLLAARRAVRPYWLLTIIAVLLVVWMYPRHKLFEPAIALAGVFFAVRLIERPEPGRYFFSGVFIGLAAFFGRNHGLYLFSAFAAVIILIRYKSGTAGSLRNVFGWLLGIAAGFLPMTLMFLFVPGFFREYVGQAIYLMKVGANLHIPVPFPWTASDIYSTFLGLLFIGMPALFIGAALWAVFSRIDTAAKALLVSASAIGFFYMHHAFARADISHLAQAIHPFLLALIALPAILNSRTGTVAAVLAGIFLLSASAFTIIRESPCWKRAYGDFIQYKIGKDSLWIDRDMAGQIRGVEAVAALAAPDEAVFIAPHWPTMYPVIGRRSPIWQIYFVYPESAEREKEMIRDLDSSNVRWVILGDVALDNRDELRFRKTHPLMWRYFKEEFTAVEAPGLPKGYEALRRRAS